MAVNECTLPSQCLAYKAPSHYNMRIDLTRRAGQSLCERCGSKEKAAMSRSRSGCEQSLERRRKTEMLLLQCAKLAVSTGTSLSQAEHTSLARSRQSSSPGTRVPLLVDCSHTPSVILPLTAGSGLSDCKKSANSRDRSSMSVKMH